MQKKQAYDRLLGVLLLVGILVVGLSVRFDFYYDLNDDTLIRDILSGRYTGEPSGYCIQMLYPLGALIAALYSVLRGISWYGLFLCTCQFGVLALVAWRVTSLAKHGWMRALLLVFTGVLALGLLGRELVIVQYSVTSAICMVGALFWYLRVPTVGRTRSYLRANLLPIVLVLLSFAIRTEMCLMLLPFLLLAGFMTWMQEKQPFTGANVRKYLMVPLTALLGMLVLYSMDAYAYRDSDWRSFRSFFDARTDLYDFYGIPDYEENHDFYESIGLSEESYTLLDNYNYSLDDSIDEALLSELVAYQRSQAEAGVTLHNTFGFVSKNSLREALWLYKERLLSTQDTHMAPLLLAAYLLYVLIASGRKNSRCYLKVLLLFCVRSVLWLYLFMVDRALDRVTLPLMLMEFTLLAGWLIQELTMCSSFSKIKIVGALSLLGVCGMACAVINMEQTCQEYELRQQANVRYDALTEYCMDHSDSYYLIDVYSSTSYEGTPYSDRLFETQDNSYRNYDVCGGWAARSPLMYEKLARSRIRDVQEALVSGAAYFIAKADADVSWLGDYYRSRGQDVSPTIADEITLDDGTVTYYVYEMK